MKLSAGSCVVCSIPIIPVSTTETRSRRRFSASAVQNVTNSLAPFQNVRVRVFLPADQEIGVVDMAEALRWV